MSLSKRISAGPFNKQKCFFAAIEKKSLKAAFEDADWLPHTGSSVSAVMHTHRPIQLTHTAHLRLLIGGWLPLAEGAGGAYDCGPILNRSTFKFYGALSTVNFYYMHYFYIKWLF